MGFRTVQHAAALLVSFDRAVTVRALLVADPRTAHLAPDWDTWLSDWKATFLQEIDHRIAVLTANAVATIRDDDLDDISTETYAATAGDPGERSFYFKGKTNKQFIAPRLGVQYQQMGTWISHMTSSTDPVITALGARLVVKHKDAGDAIKDGQDKETAQREFRHTGARKQIIDRYNALGKSTEGALEEMPHAHPELRLPKNFVDRFMRPARSVVPATVEELTKKRDAVKEELEAAQAELDTAIKAEQEAAAELARQEREADLKKLADAEAEVDKKNQEIAALRAKVDPPK